MGQGRVIAFEGVDGAGKSTALALVAAFWPDWMNVRRRSDCGEVGALDD